MLRTCISLACLFSLNAVPYSPAVSKYVRTPEPLIVDLGGNGVSLTPGYDGVRFDLDGDSVAEQTSWTTPGTDDAFLCLDENHDGRITSGYELLGGLSGPPNGFAFLAALDGFSRDADLARAQNRTPDGRIDSDDAIFGRLILWIDVNHNGVSEEDELQGLRYAGIEAIYLGYEALSHIDEAGNALRFRALCTKKNERGVNVSRDVVAVRLLRNAQLW